MNDHHPEAEIDPTTAIISTVVAILAIFLLWWVTKPDATTKVPVVKSPPVCLTNYELRVHGGYTILDPRSENSKLVVSKYGETTIINDFSIVYRSGAYSGNSTTLTFKP